MSQALFPIYLSGHHIDIGWVTAQRPRQSRLAGLLLRASGASIPRRHPGVSSSGSCQSLIRESMLCFVSGVATRCRTASLVPLHSAKRQGSLKQISGDMRDGSEALADAASFSRCTIHVRWTRGLIAPRLSIQQSVIPDYNITFRNTSLQNPFVPDGTALSLSRNPAPACIETRTPHTSTSSDPLDHVPEV